MKNLSGFFNFLTQKSVDYEFRRQYEIVTNVYIAGTLCALGIAGNLLSIVVLGRDNAIRRTTGFLLQMLASADVSYLISCVFFKTLLSIEKWTDWLPAVVSRRWAYVELCAWPAASVTHTASVWLVVLLTADRYIAICHPLHAIRYSTMPRLRRAVAAVWLFAIVFNLPKFFERAVITETAHRRPLELIFANYSVNLRTMVETAVDEQQRARLVSSSLRENRVYFIVYVTCCFFVFRFLVPFASLVFFNQRLIRTMRQSSHFRHNNASEGGRERQHTWIVVVVVVVFLLCELPTVAMRAILVLLMYFPDRVTSSVRDLVIFANHPSNLMLTVNSSINVVIYCFIGRQFRDAVLRVICCRDGQQTAPRNSLAPGSPVTSDRPSTPLTPLGPPGRSRRRSPTSQQLRIAVETCRQHSDDVTADSATHRYADSTPSPVALDNISTV